MVRGHLSARTIKLAVLAMAGVASLVAGGSCTPTEGFECGRPLPSDDSVIRSCTRAHELCVCATNSCAVPATDCDSGFRYVGEPFANPDAANGCVAPDVTQWVVAPGQTNACGDTSDAAVQDAAIQEASSDACTNCDGGGGG